MGEYLVDPDAVFLQSGENQPNFRVMSTQRLKVHGMRVVGCFKGTEIDVLQDRTSRKTVELSKDGPKDKKILVLETSKCPAFKNMKVVERLIDEIRKRNRPAMIQINEMIGDDDDIVMNGSINEVINECATKGVPNSVMAFNLFCRRMGYCNTNLLKKMSEDKDFGELPKLISLNEDNAIMDAAKFKKKPHHRNDPELSMGRPPWFRVYVGHRWRSEHGMRII